MKKNKDGIMPFFKYMIVLVLIITIVTLGLFKFIDVLPNEYYLILVVLLSLLAIGVSLLIKSKKSTKKRVIGTILGLIYIIFLVMIIIYELNTIDFLKRLGFKNFKN